MSASVLVGKFLETFKDFLPVQKPNTFTIDQAMEKMQASLSGANH
jgi:arylsulfatase